MTSYRSWDCLWDNYPVAAVAGLTWWSTNSLAYQFGYSDYSNPYHTEPVLTVPIEPIQAPTFPNVFFGSRRKGLPQGELIKSSVVSRPPP
jgi:hypothetical protein